MVRFILLCCLLQFSVREMNTEEQKRYQALNKDFIQLFKECKDDGLFEPAPFHVAMRLTEIITQTVLGLYFLLYTSYQFLGGFFLAVGIGRIGWVVHEAGHKSLTGNSAVDEVILKICYGKGLLCMNYVATHVYVCVIILTTINHNFQVSAMD